MRSFYRTAQALICATKPFQSKGYYTKKAEKAITESTTYEDLYTTNQFKEFLALAPFISEENADVEYLNSILKKHFDDDCDSPTRSMFAKVICVYDYLKYKKQSVM